MNSRPRIGVLTFHRCINYGSYWQARCLVEGLREWGLDAVILDHRSRRVDIAEWKCAFRPQLPTPTPPADCPLYREKIERFSRSFCELPLSKPFPLRSPELLEEFDVIVVGSDEVWNPSHPWYGNEAIFFGAGLPARRLISYAASFGNYGWQWGLESRWVELLKRFDALAVRDENSARLVRDHLGCEPEMTLDPCLQFPPVVPDQWSGPEGRYLALYGHSFTAEFADNIRRWAREWELPIVSLGYRNDWADEQWLQAGPTDFLGFMNRAAAVATNYFHGCVFSLVNRQPFACEITPYRRHKLEGLLTQVGAEGHLLGAGAGFEKYRAVLESQLEPSIAERLQALRRTSTAYLTRALL